jgi:translation initiation factor 3 subunit L
MKIKLFPDAEEIAPFVQEDQLFLILYKELYYRHIYARVQGGPTIEQRFDKKIYSFPKLYKIRTIL